MKEWKKVDGASPSRSVQLIVSLPGHHIAALDRVLVELRLRRRFSVTRSELIGILIEAVRTSDVDLSEGSSADTIAAAALTLFGRG